MKKFLLILTTMLFAIVALAGCGADNKQGQNKVIKVGATSVPHAEILEQIKDDLKKDGITLEIVEYSDYVQPNLNLNDKELDANYFQHIPYLEDFVKQHPEVKLVMPVVSTSSQWVFIPRRLRT